MIRVLFSLFLLCVSTLGFAGIEELYWEEGVELWPPFESIFISNGMQEGWDKSDQLDWRIGHVDILDRPKPIWTESSREFAVAPWLYEGFGLWATLMDGVPIRSLVVPDMATGYVRSLDPALVSSVELIYGGAPYLYGMDLAFGVAGVSLPNVSFKNEAEGSSELYGRISTREREQSSWWRATLEADGFGLVGQLSGRSWENERYTLTREQYLKIAAMPVSGLGMGASILSRHVNNIETEHLFSDFGSNQAFVNLDYEREGLGLTNVKLAVSAIDLETDDYEARSVRGWRWVGGRLSSNFQAGWTLRGIIGIEGMGEEAEIPDEEEAGYKDVGAALGAGFALLRFEPADGLAIAPGVRYDRTKVDTTQSEFLSPSLRVSLAPSAIFGFIASYDRSDGLYEEYSDDWDSWKFGIKISDERVRGLFGVGYLNSETDSPWAFGRMRIFLGYNWRFDFSTVWVRWDQDFHHLFGNIAVRFFGLDKDWWVEWAPVFAMNRELSGFFWRHDLYARFRFFRYLSLRAGVENVFDRRYNLEVMEFNQRNYRFQLEFCFGI